MLVKKRFQKKAILCSVVYSLIFYLETRTNEDLKPKKEINKKMSYLKETFFSAFTILCSQGILFKYCACANIACAILAQKIYI